MSNVTVARVGPPIEALSDCPESIEKICREIANIRGWSVNDVWMTIRKSAILLGIGYNEYAQFVLDAARSNALSRPHVPLA